jgi:hypothetical protein
VKLVTIIGEPASGKSALVDAFVHSLIENVGTASQSGMIKYHDFPNSKIVVIGDYKFKLSRFPGTDKLSMQATLHFHELLSVMSRGPWADHTVVWEGDRLSGRKLLTELAIAYPMTVIKLVVPEAIIQQRHQLRGDRQSKRFISGRRTKAGNLMNDLPAVVERMEFANSNRDDLNASLRKLRSICLGVDEEIKALGLTLEKLH